MPVRAFLDSDIDEILRRLDRMETVSMPVRAFLDSDIRWCMYHGGNHGKRVSMPVRAFLDSDGNEV